MKHLWITLLVVGLVAVAATADTVFSAEGEICVEYPTLVVSSDASFVSGYSGDVGDVSVELSLDSATLDEFLVYARAVIANVELAAELTLPVQTSSDTCLQVNLGTTAGGIDVETVLVAEDGVAGLEFSLSVEEPNPVEQLTFGFNLDEALAPIQPTCAFQFSRASAAMRFPLPCDLGSLRVEPSWTCSGFDQLAVTLGPIPEVLPGLRFSIEMTYTTEEKTVELIPSLSVASSFCVTPFLSLDWDKSAVSLNGLKVLALDMRCEIGAVRARGILELSPGDVALVADPYCGLFGLIWSVTGCCGEEGEASIAFFFGSGPLLGIAAIALEAEIPVLPGLVLNPQAMMKLDGTGRFSLDWSYDLADAVGSAGTDS